MSYANFQKRMVHDAGRIHWRPEHYQTLAKHFGVSEEQVAKAVAPAPAMASFPETVTKGAVADVQRSFRWTMNDGNEIDRHGDQVIALGVDTSSFRSNPIALLQHDTNKPIGTWAGVHAEGGKLKGTLNLAPTHLGEYVRENIAHNVLKTASIGFVPIEFTPIKGGGFRFEKIELMETSIVSIPASRGSLRERELTPDERKAEAAAYRALAEADLAAVAQAQREAAVEERMASTSPAQRKREREAALIRIRGQQ
jgi:HK97 family phage prohead protease